MKNRHKVARRRRTFESLEQRNLLAGNVSAVSTAGFLSITGDNAANAISITQVDATTFKVTGIGTKVNGSNSPQTISAITTGFDIAMLGGADSVTMKNISVGVIGVTLDTGNDSLVMTGVHTTDALYVSDIADSDGNNAISLINCSFTNGLAIRTSSGRDVVAMSRTTIDGGLDIELGNGTNVLSMVNVNVQGESALPTLGSVPHCGAIIIGGSGVDAIAMVNVKIDCFTQIDTLGGGDSVTIVNSRFGNLAAATPFATADVEPNVDDPTLVDPSLNDTLTGLYVETGSGTDAVAIATTKVYGHLDVDTSGELFASHVGLLVNDAKDGNDSVVLNNVQVLDDGKQASQTGDDLDSGEVAIYTGNQGDAVVLNGVGTDGFAYIQTTDTEDTSLDGADVVAIANCTFDRLDPDLVSLTVDHATDPIVFGLAIQTGNGNDVVSIVNVKVTEATIIETGNGTDHVAISSLTETPNPISADLIYVDLGNGKYDTLSIVNSSSGNAQFYGGGNTGDTLVKSHNNFQPGGETDTGFQHVFG